MSAVERAYAAAGEWRRAAEAVEDARAELNRAADAVTANNAGSAVEGFDRARRVLAAPGRDGALAALEEACRMLADRCEQYAAQLATAKY
jgi:hypothetical protein